MAGAAIRRGHSDSLPIVYGQSSLGSGIGSAGPVDHSTDQHWLSRNSGGASLGRQDGKDSLQRRRQDFASVPAHLGWDSSPASQEWRTNLRRHLVSDPDIVGGLHDRRLWLFVERRQKFFPRKRDAPQGKGKSAGDEIQKNNR